MKVVAPTKAHRISAHKKNYNEAFMKYTYAVEPKFI